MTGKALESPNPPPWGRRTLWHEDIDGGKKPGDSQYGKKDNPRRQVDDPAQANLIGSLIAGEFSYDALSGLAPPMHMPALDIDLPCSLLPSTTRGHFHLLIDKAVPWAQYADLLRVLAACGVIEDGYYQAALRRGATFIRMPGTRKPAPAALPAATERRPS